MRHLMMVGDVDGATLFKQFAMRVRGFFAGRAAKLMSKGLAVHTAQLDANVAKSESPTPAWARRSSTNLVYEAVAQIVGKNPKMRKTIFI